jgi:alanyl-tRNA synthetase
MKVETIRKTFLDYFAKHQHTVVASSSLVPQGDDTLLFTNAGMNQFKDVFLGQDKRAYTRAATAQRCVRAGGKHNDLENVGYTARHHTFFEMLGNFSFGDYFKKEAIQFAWNLLTIEFKIPKEKLWVSVYKDDQEAADIWIKEIGVSPDRLSRCGEDDNFWSMGDTGPCGPCTEIFYDHGPEVWGGPPGSPDQSGDRYIEIWNLVFMQYNRTQDGKLHPLPKPSVDTGMGIERLAAILQGVHSNYEIDLFHTLIHQAGKILGVDPVSKKTVQSLRVIADHIRSCAFLVADGVFPSNESRGYVLRRIIRRAIRHGHKCGAVEPFFYQLVAPLVRLMGEAYPELKNNQQQVEKVLRQEEEQFNKTLEQGLRILDTALQNIPDEMIPGDLAFKLYDTYGFPLDLTNDIARERNFTVDSAGFEQAMNAQRERARAASHFGSDYGNQLSLQEKTEFVGYHELKSLATVQKILVNHQEQSSYVFDQKNPDGLIQVILDHTPFYAESGGQVGDKGVLKSAEGVLFQVLDTQKINQAIVHTVQCLSGKLAVGDKLTAEVDKDKRTATMLNHSATHLLHAALRNVLGSHVTQKGSLVEPDRLRFDFSHFSALSPEEITQVENIVNEKIIENSAAEVTLMSTEEALKSGAMALFGEKYGDTVRVLKMGGEFSVELCGGTHAARTGDIGLMKIISEAGVASGVRRIEAITGQKAFARFQEDEKMLQVLSGIFKSDRTQITQKISQVLDQLRKIEKENERLKQQLATGQAKDYASQAKMIQGVQVLVQLLPAGDAKTLRTSVDDLKNKLGTGVVVLALLEDTKIILMAGVTKDLVSKIHAGELVNFVSSQVGGKGGGRPDFAQAGGDNPAGLDKALESVYDWVEKKLFI